MPELEADILHSIRILLIVTVALLLPSHAARADQHDVAAPSGSAGKTVNKAWFGMFVKNANFWTTEKNGLGKGEGAVLTTVDRGFAAERAGLKTYDILIAINGKPVKGYEHALELLGKTPIGGQAKFVILRDGKKLEKTIVTSAMPLHQKVFNDAWDAIDAKKPDAALKLFVKAAEMGNLAAMADLGDMYRTGDGVKASGKEAAKWYGMALEKDHVEGMLGMGVLYYTGDGVEKSLEKTAELFIKAADLGVPVAMQNLAILLDDGEGVGKDSKKAAALTLAALKKGDEFTLSHILTTNEDRSDEFRMEFQRLMKADGLYDGTIDGVFTKELKATITKYFGSS